MKRLELLIPPPFVTLLIGLVMWALSRMVPTLNLAWVQNTRVAFVVALLGLAISLVSMAAFRRAHTTMDPKRPESAMNLISSGIYRYSRNPMYLGVLLVLVGWAIYLLNLLSMLCIPLFIAFITRFQIIPEERLLHQKFGMAFESYKNKVRRWL